MRGLEVRFEGGRVVDINADEGAGALRSRTEVDEGAARLGEVALVDGAGRVGPLGTVFYDTLLDENAASHVALGRAYPFAAEDEADVARSNVSAIHIDFMIGSAEVGVTGITTDGDPRADPRAAATGSCTTATLRHRWRGAGVVERAALEMP